MDWEDPIIVQTEVIREPLVTDEDTLDLAIGTVLTLSNGSIHLGTSRIISQMFLKHLPEEAQDGFVYGSAAVSTILDPRFPYDLVSPNEIYHALHSVFEILIENPRTLNEAKSALLAEVRPVNLPLGLGIIIDKNVDLGPSYLPLTMEQADRCTRMKKRLDNSMMTHNTKFELSNNVIKFLANLPTEPQIACHGFAFTAHYFGAENPELDPKNIARAFRLALAYSFRTELKLYWDGFNDHYNQLFSANGSSNKRQTLVTEALCEPDYGNGER